MTFRSTSVASCPLLACFSEGQRPLPLVFLKVNALDEDSLTMDLEFRIQETTCRRESEADPATCDFQRGYQVVSVGQRPPAWKQTPESSAFLHHPEPMQSHTEVLAVSGVRPPSEAPLTVSTLFPGWGRCDSVVKDLSSEVCHPE